MWGRGKKSQARNIQDWYLELHISWKIWESQNKGKWLVFMVRELETILSLRINACYVSDSSCTVTWLPFYLRSALVLLVIATSKHTETFFVPFIRGQFSLYCFLKSENLLLDSCLKFPFLPWLWNSPGFSAWFWFPCVNSSKDINVRMGRMALALEENMFFSLARNLESHPTRLLTDIGSAEPVVTLNSEVRMSPFSHWHKIPRDNDL